MNKDDLLAKFPWPNSFEIDGQKIIDTFTVVPLKSEASAIWEWLSDSSRINRALGMGKRLEIERDGQLIVRTKMLGIVQEWIELPWSWVSGESIIVDREYNTGFAKYNHSIFYFKDNSLYIYMGFTPSSLLSKSLLTVGVKSVVADLANLLSEIDSELMSGMAVPSFFTKSIDSLNDEQKVLLNSSLESCKSSGMDDDIISRIYDLICLGDELDLYRIRLKELSVKWDLDERKLLRNFLIATKHNVFKMSWDIICPSCLGPRTEVSELVDLLNVDHCEACKIKFETDGENSIEVTFKVNPKIRAVEKLQFCAAEPARKKHIKVQWSSKDNFVKKSLYLPSGEYRLRVLGHDGSMFLSISDSGESDVLVDLSGSEIKVNNLFTINIPNEIENGIVIIEDKDADPMALRPRDVFSISDFKKLFSEQELGQGIQLYLGEQTILFTDIVSSTKYYESFGDKYAFEEIKKHFGDVYRVFEEFNGVIIKTIGDAVMASFPSPLLALKACEKVHEIFNPNHTNYNFQLRMSSHIGKVIGVNSDTGIDYFGNTVNVAAKLQNIADDQQLGVSDEFFKSLGPDDILKWDVERKKITVPGKSSELDVVTLTFKE